MKSHATTSTTDQADATALVLLGGGLYDTRAAARYLGVSPSFLEHARTEGRPCPRAVRLGRRVLYRRVDLDAFAEELAA